MEDSILDFSPKNRLNPKFWRDDDKLHPALKQVLTHIAKEFMGGLGKNIIIEDIRFTGSLANYRYNKGSDVDLHIVVDFDRFGERKDLLKRLFAAKSSLWNIKHDIKVRGYEVELYVEDISVPHHSTGVYSITHDQWIAYPSDKFSAFNTKALYSKVERYIEKIERMVNRRATTLSQVNNLINKIRLMRKEGLEEGGELSVENLTFKALRRGGYIEKLFKLRNDLYDQKLSYR